jgi:hypothetical protein
MTKWLAAVAGMAGTALIAGTNGTLALGIGLLVFAVFLVVNDIVERLERIEHAVDDMRDHTEAERLSAALARSEAGESPSAEEE